jgi:glycosyltransferase involved in cell wall biosynthesis
VKISGFTFCRDAVRFDYPVEESIRSLLPLVDEYVVAVGTCDDGTLELVRSIGDPKLKIVESVWDESLRKDGLVYAQQTNLALSHCRGDWAFYLQADEVVHEDDLARVRSTLERYHDDHRVLALMFRYLHFRGDYWSTDPWMYRKEIRVIRHNGRVRSQGDATGFASDATEFSRNIRSEPSSWVWSGGRIFHYGYVKHPRTLMAKIVQQAKVYDPEIAVGFRKLRHRVDPAVSEYPLDERYGVLKEYRGSHPAVMRNRIVSCRRLASRRNRWLNPRFYGEVFRHGFKG